MCKLTDQYYGIQNLLDENLDRSLPSNRLELVLSVVVEPLSGFGVGQAFRTSEQGLINLGS